MLFGLLMTGRGGVISRQAAGLQLYAILQCTAGSDGVAALWWTSDTDHMLTTAVVLLLPNQMTQWRGTAGLLQLFSWFRSLRLSPQFVA
jgi:hypothetical protein